MKWFNLLLRVIIAALFLGAGVAKLLDPAEFERDILAYQLLEGWSASGLAVYLPWLEIVTGALLLLPRTARSAAGMLLGLMGVFIAAQVAAWARGIDTSCGCFGFQWDLAAVWMLARDMALAGILAAIVMMNDAPEPVAMRQLHRSGNEPAYHGNG